MELRWVIPFSVFVVLTGEGISGETEENLIPEESGHPTNGTQKPKLSDRPIFLVISYDGFRFDYFSKANTPNLDWVKNNGVSAPYMKVKLFHLNPIS